VAKVKASQCDIDRRHTGHMATWNHVVFETHEGGPDQSRRRMSRSVWAAYLRSGHANLAQLLRR
jgi:hypothetical protein